MNVNFQYSKTLAGEGAILLLLGLIPTIGWVLGIVGVVLLLKATKELSYYYQDDSIYQNSLTGLKYYIGGLVAAAVAIVVGVILFAATGLFSGEPFAIVAGNIAGILIILAGLVIAFAFYLLAASHLKQVFETLATKTGESSFSTAGTLFYVGAILTIVGVGLLLILISWIFATIGFFSMKPKDYQPYYPQNGNGYTAPPQAQPIQNSQNH